jgi:hypothetical protein
MLGRGARHGRLRNEQNLNRLCERLADGISLRDVAKEMGFAPSSITDWMREDAAAAARYVQARELGYERLADEVIAIGDADYRLPDGTVDNAAVQQARLRSDNRKWLLAKMMPKRYGDRVTAEVVGDANAPLITRIELVAVPAVHRAIGPVIDAGCDGGDDRPTFSKPAETLD